MRRIRKKSRLAKAGLTPAQRLYLMTGVEFAREQPFATGEEYQSAYWQHRAELLAASQPFHRPFGYWDVELDLPPPGSRASGYEDDRQALARLRLELTPAERSMLNKETHDGN
jgi:hypothetical protein